MYILSQNKDVILNLSPSGVVPVCEVWIPELGRNAIRIKSEGERRKVIGLYPTESRAKEVLTELFQVLYSNNTAYAMPAMNATPAAGQAQEETHEQN